MSRVLLSWSSESETHRLAGQMVELGFRAVITCVDPKQLPVEFAGRHYDAELLQTLPDGVDPCGERGEFHTFCFAGPVFDAEISIQVGDSIMRDGFCFTEVSPGSRD